MARFEKGKAAYFLVDLNTLPSDVRSIVYEDALAGGSEYGVRIVEEIHNGAARRLLFGVYYDVKKPDGSFHTSPQTGGDIGNDETKWNAAKDAFGLNEEEPVADDGEALRLEAEKAAAEEAERLRLAEEEAVREVVGDDKVDDSDAKKPVNKAKHAR